MRTRWKGGQEDHICIHHVLGTECQIQHYHNTMKKKIYKFHLYEAKKKRWGRWGPMSFKVQRIGTTSIETSVQNYKTSWVKLSNVELKIYF